MKKSTLSKSVLLAALSLAAGSAAAGGFQLTEQSALGLGRAYAGVGVDGTDISGIHYNPATMTLHSGTNAQLGGVGVGLNLDYRGDNGSRDNGRKKPAFVPSAFISTQLNDNLWAGLAMTAPFGLATEFSENWDQWSKGVNSKIQVLDFNPNLAYKLNDKLSFGAGVSVQYAKANLGNKFAIPQLPSINTETVASSTAWGYNLGVMYTPVENVRLGLSYRSAISHHATGDFSYDVPNIPDRIINSLPQEMRPLLSQGHHSLDAQISMDAPAWLMFNGAWDINDTFSVYASYRHTDWSSFKSLTLKTSKLSTSLDTKWKDTDFFSVGYDARINPFWTLRGGLAYETSAVDDPKLRAGTIPDADRWWISVGSSFKWTDNLQTDVSFAHLRGVHERGIYTGDDKTGYTHVGKFHRLDAYLVGVQMQYKF